MNRVVTAATLVWLGDVSFEAGTPFTVMDKAARENRFQDGTGSPDGPHIDVGTADLWVRQGKAVEGSETKAR